MSDKSPLRPVVFMYPETVGNYLAGSTFQAASPDAVWRVHPQAQIVRYVDGGAYKERAAKDAVRLRDNPPAAQTADTAPATAANATEEKAETPAKKRK